MALEGKGIYLWKIDKTEGGEPERIADLAREAGLTHVLIKIADGPYRYNYDWARKVDLVPPVVQALRSRNISPWGWHYVRGDDPAGEARIAVDQVRSLNLEGYVIDAEVHYKNKFSAADSFMRYLRKDLPTTTIALSSYRFPSYHRDLPWREFLSRCDLNMPQVYWQGASNPDVQLRRCMDEFRKMDPWRPILPTGAAYREHNWQPTNDQVVTFMEEARRLGLAGVNFWEWNAARSLGFWEVIGAYDWSKPKRARPRPPTSPRPVDFVERYIAALNSRKPDSVMQFYKEEAIHISPGRSIQGVGEIIGFYAQLFMVSLPSATFRLTGLSGTGSVRRFTWTATSPLGKVLDGKDFMGIFDGKIGFHRTSFTITQ